MQIHMPCRKQDMMQIAQPQPLALFRDINPDSTKKMEITGDHIILVSPLSAFTAPSVRLMPSNCRTLKMQNTINLQTIGFPIFPRTEIS